MRVTCDGAAAAVLKPHAFCHVDPLARAKPRSAPAVLGHRFIHASDMLRLSLLYKHGGLYLDSDVLVMREFR